MITRRDSRTTRTVGSETITIIRKGEVRHGDSLGHAGTIGPGDIQWMTSGSGILHEEMPQVRPEGIGGLQIWLNLPAKDKMTRPKYRDLRSDLLPETETDEGAKIPRHRRRRDGRAADRSGRGANRLSQVRGRLAAGGRVVP